MSPPSTTTAPLIPDRIVPELYISDMLTARAVLSPNYQTPAKTRPKIRYILSLLDQAGHQPQVANESQQSNFVFKLILLHDTLESNLLAVLQDACAFIKTAIVKKDGGILVHCQQGVSRSASVILAYIMEDMDLDYDTALRFVRTARAKVRPNTGFEKQLRLWRDMRYSIYDESGTEKAQYNMWKNANIKYAKGQTEKLSCATQMEHKIPQATVEGAAEE